MLALPGVAQAQQYDSGNSDSERSARDGTGDAEARARANDDGRLRVFTEAEGGKADDGPLPGPGASEPAVARASAELTRRVPVADGTYKVVVHYRGLQGDDRERGRNGDADIKRRSIVRFEAQAGGGDRTVRRSQELPSREGNRSTRLFIKVPNDSSGSLRVTGLLKAFSTASGKRGFGQAAGHVDDISFTVKRVSE